MTKLFLLSFFFVLGCGFWGGCEAKGEAGLPPVIPMKDFFRNPEKARFQLSPNGRHLAFMEPWKNRMNVHVQKIGEKKAVRITNATKRDIAGYFWANNHRIAFVQDKGGDDYVGVSNIFTLLETIPPYWELGRQMFYEMVGDPVKDKALLEEVSPVFHVDQIKAPLFIAQGANDPRVKKAESDQVVEALKKRDIDVPYMVKDNEGHGFHNEENRFDFYRAMEKFLHKYLGGRVEAE